MNFERNDLLDNVVSARNRLAGLNRLRSIGWLGILLFRSGLFLFRFLFG